MVIFEIAISLTTSEMFRDVYGMRFVGLQDFSDLVYFDYRVPDPEAPYPQDYVIDQDGIVRYWSWEYSPKEVIRTIDRLLGITPAHDRPPEDGGNIIKRIEATNRED